MDSVWRIVIAPNIIFYQIDLGFGGQFGYFGLWIDSDFGKGSCKGTPVCTTYGNDILSGGEEEDFSIDMIEVWCVKEAELDDRLMEKKSAMLANPEVCRN